MKLKSNTHFSELIYGIRIFRDDIEEVLTLLTKKSLKIEIHDSKNIYENIDEVINLRGNKSKKIKIEGKDNSSFESVTIDIEGNRVWICSSGSENMYSFGFELKDFFKSKVPWHYKVFNPWIFGLLIIPAFYISNYYVDEKTNSILYHWVNGVCFIIDIILLLSILIRNNSYGLTLSRKHEYGFLNRNKDKIIVAVITALLGSLLTLLIQWLTKL